MKIQGLQGDVDVDQLKTHVISPPNIQGITTDRGRHDWTPPAPPKTPPTPGPVAQFNGQGFCDTLHAAIKNAVVGYTMRIQQHGSIIWTLEWNWAQTPLDASEGWNPDVVMHVASVSKLITAMATTKLLNSKGISYDASIAPYLPDYWPKGPNIATVTFRQLMTHTSGFTNGGADFPSVKAQIALGVPLTKSYAYENSNFSLLRVLIPVINGNVAVTMQFPSFPFPEPGLSDILWNMNTVNYYQEYVNANVIGPSGSEGSFVWSPGDALAYTYPTSIKGWDSGDLSTVTGAAGWHFSVDQLLKIMGTFRRAGTILSTTQAQTMLDDSFGIDWIVQRPVDQALMYIKNGLWANGNGQTEQSVAFFLPDDMEMVVLVNSPINATSSFLASVVQNAYTQNVT